MPLGRDGHGIVSRLETLNPVAVVFEGRQPVADVDPRQKTHAPSGQCPSAHVAHQHLEARCLDGTPGTALQPQRQRVQRWKSDNQVLVHRSWPVHGPRIAGAAAHRDHDLTGCEAAALEHALLVGGGQWRSHLDVDERHGATSQDLRANDRPAGGVHHLALDKLAFLQADAAGVLVTTPAHPESLAHRWFQTAFVHQQGVVTGLHTCHPEAAVLASAGTAHKRQAVEPLPNPRWHARNHRWDRLPDDEGALGVEALQGGELEDRSGMLTACTRAPATGSPSGSTT